MTDVAWGAVLCLTALIPLAGAQAQPVAVGGRVFEDARQFAVTATVTEGLLVPRVLQTSELTGWLGAASSSLQEAVCGHDLQRGVYIGDDYGYGGNGACWTEAPSAVTQRLELGFDPAFAPEEGAGPDLALFDAQRGEEGGSAQKGDFAFDFSFLLADGRWTPRRLFSDGGPYVQPLITVAGLPQPDGKMIPELIRITEIDLGQFGVPVGQRVRAMRIWTSCAVTRRARAYGKPLDQRSIHGIAASAGLARPCDQVSDCAAPDPCTGVRCEAHRCHYFSLARGADCEGGYCDGAPRPRCVPCTEDAHCAAPTPRCDTSSTATCVGCLEAADCQEAPETCREASCEGKACQYQRPAPRGTACEGGYCDGAPAPACVPCTEDAHCPANHRCAPEGSCVRCLADADCAVDDPCVTRALCVKQACVYDTDPACEGKTEPDPKKDPPVPPTPPTPPEDAQPKLLRDEGCGCTHTRPGPGWLPLLGLALLTLRRRRR